MLSERSSTTPGSTRSILTGDRDDFCTVEQAVTAYRQLPDGELAILPGHGHYIPPSAIQTTVEFLTRRLGTQS